MRWGISHLLLPPVVFLHFLPQSGSKWWRSWDHQRQRWKDFQVEDGLGDCGNDAKPTPSCCSSLSVSTHDQHQVPDAATRPPQTRPAHSCQLRRARTTPCAFSSLLAKC